MNKNSIEFKPNWIKKNKIKYSKSFFEIINFYVFETPCINVSSRGIEFKELGWDKKELNELFEYMLLSEEIIENNNYFRINNIYGVSKKIKEYDIRKKSKRNLIIMYKSEKEINNLLYYIRCAIAHGRFAINGKGKNKIYTLENIKFNINNKKEKSTYKVRIILKETTLINWSNLIKKGKNEFEKRINKIKMLYQNKIFDYINKNKEIKEENIKKLILEDKSQFHKYFNKVWEELKANKKVCYDKQIKTWFIKK